MQRADSEFQSYLRSDSDMVPRSYCAVMMRPHFNPTLGLILTPVQRSEPSPYPRFQSYLRSDSDMVYTKQAQQPLSHFNPTLGLILTKASEC